jgi:2-polyprenyl-3-methyl-5-hydroxy-6-metoxy-1,4-benzoquinol methylase
MDARPRLKRTLLTRLLGPTAGLIQGDFLTRDRWLWTAERLPETANGDTLLDVGCGTGAFTIAAARRGYTTLGLTFSTDDASIASERAQLCHAPRAAFEVADARQLDQRADLAGRFDFAICCETIEHIIDDRRLVCAIERCLKPGGRLLLTTPNFHYRAICRGDLGPFEIVEAGWHVRRGYSRAQLHDLFADTGLWIEEISFCSGFLSQKLTSFLRLFDGRFYLLGWILTLPFRPFVPLADRVLHAFSRYPQYSICVQAFKPRHNPSRQPPAGMTTA